MIHPVLVVDDDLDIRSSLIEVLEDAGYAAMGASNGRDALEKLRKAEIPPCLIFLDLMMPVMDGRAFREEQLRSPALADIPVVIVSAYRDVHEHTVSMQVNDVLKKPLAIEELLQAAQKYCPTLAAG